MNELKLTAEQEQKIEIEYNSRAMDFIAIEKCPDSIVVRLTTVNDVDDENSGVRAMEEFVDYYLNDINSDNVMFEFFEAFIANSEWDWVRPEEIGALTDAPILGIRDKYDNVIEAYAFMDYQVKSLMQQLADYGEAILQRG